MQFAMFIVLHRDWLKQQWLFSSFYSSLFSTVNKPNNQRNDFTSGFFNDFTASNLSIDPQTAECACELVTMDILRWLYIFIYIYVCGYFYSKYFLLERSTTLKCVFVCKRFCCRWFGIDKEHTHILMNVSERATVRSFAKTSNQRFVLRFFFT